MFISCLGWKNRSQGHIQAIKILTIRLGQVFTPSPENKDEKEGMKRKERRREEGEPTKVAGGSLRICSVSSHSWT